MKKPLIVYGRISIIVAEAYIVIFRVNKSYDD